MFRKTLSVAFVRARYKDFIIHFFFGDYTIIKEHDFKIRKSDKGVD